MILFLLFYILVVTYIGTTICEYYMLLFSNVLVICNLFSCLYTMWFIIAVTPSITNNLCIKQIQVDIGNADESIVFRSSCSRVEFLGFQAAYEV